MTAEQRRPAKTQVQQEKQNPPAALVVDSRELLQGQQEIQIEHDGQRYRLRVTRTGKLILHK